MLVMHQNSNFPPFCHQQIVGLKDGNDQLSLSFIVVVVGPFGKVILGMNVMVDFIEPVQSLLF